MDKTNKQKNPMAPICDLSFGDESSIGNLFKNLQCVGKSQIYKVRDGAK